MPDGSIKGIKKNGGEALKLTEKRRGGNSASTTIHYSKASELGLGRRKAGHFASIRGHICIFSLKHSPKEKVEHILASTTTTQFNYTNVGLLRFHSG